VEVSEGAGTGAVGQTMHAKNTLVGTLLILVATHEMGHGQSRATNQEVGLNNFHHELTTCFAYYAIAQQCTANRGDSESLAFAQSFNPIKERLLLYQYAIAKQIKMTQDAQISRQSIEMKEMLSLIQNSCTNISSLYSRHAHRCKFVAEQPENALSEWLAK
jgi:hypothetical protein